MEHLIAPMLANQSVPLYAEFISGLSVSLQMLDAGMVKKLLEKMDHEFRVSPGRTDRYCVKQTRERTIVTIFGEVTYKRTEYIDKGSSKPFIYANEEIGLFRRQRYDSVIGAVAYEAYGHSTSMIEVGRQIGLQA